VESAESLFDEIRKAGLLITNDWLVRQNNALDNKTRHIYNCHSLVDLDSHSVRLDLSPEESAYAVHRWRNFKRHDAWQSLLFEQVPDIKIVENLYSKKQDFVISTAAEDIPFDLKVTRYPKSIQGNLTDRELADWFYRNQSKEGRFHLANRFFVVGQPEEALYDIDVARHTIGEFASDMRSYRHFIQHPDGQTSRAVVLRQTAAK